MARAQWLRLFLDASYSDIVDGPAKKHLRPRRYARSIRLYRRADVAALVAHVGVKS